ncbi:disks large-associated protein 5 isoform X2 [Xenopus laevis]|nr:disks large-associated protein 5 isoform X2 [Xenopus laevis]
METQTQFVGRYKKDLSIENLRAKVARRKSITQKESRHNEFKKCRGLSLADANVSVLKECELPPLEETNESSILKAQETTLVGKSKEHLNQRRDMLQRFKEEKQLRKLKEQREKAAKGVFKCGTYKSDGTILPVWGSQPTAKIKPKEKQAPPAVPRITRSMAKAEPAGNKTNKTQHVTTVLNSSKISVERGITKGCGQNSALKKPVTKVAPSQRGVRAAVTTTSTTKPALRNNVVTKSQNKTTKETKTIENAKKSQISEQPKLKEAKPLPKENAVEMESSLESHEAPHERKPSFAPQNFVFKPMDGLSPYKFKPMTPRRANAFLTPCFIWSPLKGERNNLPVPLMCNKEQTAVEQVPESSQVEKVLALEHMPEPESSELEVEHKSEPESSELEVEHGEKVLPVEQIPEPESSDLEMANHSVEQQKVPADVFLTAADAPILPSSPTPNIQKENEQEAPKEPEHGVPYFRDILKFEIGRLSLLCCEWDKRIEMDIPEDAKDLIRTTVGQTRLLMNERFKQFEGLVDNCEFKRGDKETTCTDLEGFWDMIYFQIEDVKAKFVNLGKLEENSWQQNTAPTKKIIKKKIAPAATSKSSQGDNGRAAARSRLAAIKAALKNKGKQEEPNVEAPALPTQVEEVVFDAGFFRVASPAKVANSFRAKCSSSWSSPTPQPITSCIQQSENSTGEQMTEATPATVTSPIRKSLFENTEEESLQIDEMHSVPVAETDKAACAFQVADLTKYLVPTEHSSFQLCESPVPEEVGMAPSRSVFVEETAGISVSFVDDVFTCSPQTNGPPAQPTSPPRESDGVCGPQDVNALNDHLDFLGSCTPFNMVNRATFKCDAVTTGDDLMVFSPLQK